MRNTQPGWTADKSASATGVCIATQILGNTEPGQTANEAIATLCVFLAGQLPESNAKTNRATLEAYITVLVQLTGEDFGNADATLAAGKIRCTILISLADQIIRQAKTCRSTLEALRTILSGRASQFASWEAKAGWTAGKPWRTIAIVATAERIGNTDVQRATGESLVTILRGIAGVLGSWDAEATNATCEACSTILLRLASKSLGDAEASKTANKV